MLQRRFGVLTAVMVIVCSLIAVLPALADSNVRIVRLSHINGDAQINHNDKDQGFTHAVLNMPVTTGMWLYTPSGARAEVQFENGSTVRLVEDAQVQFEKLALANNGGKINTILVDHGMVYLNFPKVDKHDQIRIEAAGQTFRVNKPTHLRLNLNEKLISFAVLKGQAEMEGDYNVQVKGEQTLYIDPADSSHYKLAKGTDQYGSDAWDKGREEELAAIEARSNNSLATNSMFDAQFASLGYYGNFFSVPGYGNVWQPFGMGGAGWNPYMNGMWGFYPGMGYAWISTYPWGWAPYRYGQWNFLPTYGWVWAPGSTATAWNLGPRFGAVPSGFKAPTQPPITAGVKPAQMVVVGNPSNVHPAVLSGHPTLNTHPAPALTQARPTMMNRGRSAMAAENANPRFGNGRVSPANGGTRPAGGHASAGPASMGGGPAFGGGHASSNTGGMNGRPK